MAALLLRGGENTVASDVSATRTLRQNGATECDVSGLRATRRTCNVDTSQTKGVPSLFGKREKDDEKTTRKEDESVGERKRRRTAEKERKNEGRRRREREKLADTVRDERGGT